MKKDKAHQRQHKYLYAIECSETEEAIKTSRMPKSWALDILRVPFTYHDTFLIFQNRTEAEEVMKELRKLKTYEGIEIRLRMIETTEELDIAEQVVMENEDDLRMLMFF